MVGSLHVQENDLNKVSIVLVVIAICAAFLNTAALFIHNVMATLSLRTASKPSVGHRIGVCMVFINISHSFINSQW